MQRFCSLLCFSIFQAFFFYACNSKEVPDVSQISVDIHIERFDQHLGDLSVDSIVAKNQIWQQMFNPFYTDFMVQMLEVGDPKDSLYVSQVLREVVQKTDFIDLAAAVEYKFPNLDREEKELSEAFRFLKYYFPHYEIPDFYSFFSGFAVQTPIGSEYIGIGLDMFLGADSEFYPAILGSIPKYISQRFTPENIVPRVIEAVVRIDLLPEEVGGGSTLQHMIYHGKVLYALDCILPYVADSLKIGYTDSQQQWAQAYQEDIWAWFLSEELLYSTDYLRIQKYFSEMPFTAELGENNESAPKLGSYLGWQIVRKYMNKHPEVTLAALFENKNAQEILEQSKFRGK